MVLPTAKVSVDREHGTLIALTAAHQARTRLRFEWERFANLRWYVRNTVFDELWQRGRKLRRNSINCTGGVGSHESSGYLD